MDAPLKPHRERRALGSNHPLFAWRRRAHWLWERFLGPSEAGTGPKVVPAARTHNPRSALLRRKHASDKMNTADFFFFGR